jgi:DnaJ-class molecular chaperone
MESRVHLNHAICRHCSGTGETLPLGTSQPVTCPECLGAGALR